ncbi:MAG: hypothetical protein E6J74_20220 [Deltaproteobacteria bacterium]|nr:MAG: hypothetical protein E6J74_20220 [Deltaproteobacteria bacterium]
MTLSKKRIFVALKWLLLFLFVGGLALAILDEAVRAFRALKNKEGTMVNGFALYEKALHSPPNVKNGSFPKKELGWEFVEFYRHNPECEFWRFRKQRNWENELGRKLRERPEEKSLLQLPLVRYECGPYRTLYPAGQGWGLF